MSVSCLVCALSSVVALLRLETMFLLLYTTYTVVFRWNCLGGCPDSQLLLRCVHLRLLNCGSSVFLPRLTSVIGTCDPLPCAPMLSTLGILLEVRRHYWNLLSLSEVGMLWAHTRRSPWPWFTYHYEAVWAHETNAMWVSRVCVSSGGRDAYS